MSVCAESGIASSSAIPGPGAKMLLSLVLPLFARCCGPQLVSSTALLTPTPEQLRYQDQELGAL